MPQFTNLHHFSNGTDYHFQGNDNRELMKVCPPLLLFGFLVHPYYLKTFLFCQIVMVVIAGLGDFSSLVMHAVHSFVEFGMSRQR